MNFQYNAVWCPPLLPEPKTLPQAWEPHVWLSNQSLTMDSWNLGKVPSLDISCFSLVLSLRPVLSWAFCHTSGIHRLFGSKPRFPLTAVTWTRILSHLSPQGPPYHHGMLTQFFQKQSPKPNLGHPKGIDKRQSEKKFLGEEKYWKTLITASDEKFSSFPDSKNYQNNSNSQLLFPYQCIWRKSQVLVQRCLFSYEIQFLRSSTVCGFLNCLFLKSLKSSSGYVQAKQKLFWDKCYLGWIILM